MVKRLSSVLVVVGVLVLGACGGGDDDTAGEAAEVPAGGAESDESTTTEPPRSTTTTTAPLAPGAIGTVQKAIRDAGLSCDGQAEPGSTGETQLMCGDFWISEMSVPEAAEAGTRGMVAGSCQLYIQPPPTGGERPIRFAYLRDGLWTLTHKDAVATEGNPGPTPGEADLEKVAAQLGLQVTVVDCATAT